MVEKLDSFIKDEKTPEEWKKEYQEEMQRKQEAQLERERQRQPEMQRIVDMLTESEGDAGYVIAQLDSFQSLSRDEIALDIVSAQFEMENEEKRKPIETKGERACLLPGPYILLNGKVSKREKARGTDDFIVKVEGEVYYIAGVHSYPDSDYAPARLIHQDSPDFPKLPEGHPFKK